jgi:signal transduction histidine kinase
VDGEIRELDVSEVVSAVLLTVEPQIGAKRLDSVADVPPEVRLVADPAKLRGILLALLSNAIHYTEPGGHVMIDVGYPEDMPEDVVMLRVGDSGCGIPVERQATIFEPSARAHHADPSGETQELPDLPTCRAWAREMGGDLRVRSDAMRGSVFTLKLPRGPNSR